MITDENGVRHPECVADEVALREERQKQPQTAVQRAMASKNNVYKNGADRFFHNKAKKEGWAKP